MKFKTMTSLVVLAALSCGEKASAVLQGPFGDVINQDSRMVGSFKAPLDTSDKEQGKAALARATAVVKHKDTVANAFLADPRAALMAYYIHQLGETVLQAKLASSNSVLDKLQAIENYDSSGTTTFGDYLQGIAGDLNKGQGAFGVKTMVKLEDAFQFVTNEKAVRYFVANDLDIDRLTYLFRYSQYGLEELTGVTSSPSSHTVTSSLMPPSFEDYISKKKGYLQQVRESEELAEKTLTTSELEEENVRDEEERELRELEELLNKRKQEIANKKKQSQQELTQRKEEGLVKAYKQAFETVELLDGSLEAMLKEVDGIWDNAVQAVNSIPDIVLQSNLAAEELMRHAQRVNQTEMALQFVNSEKRKSLQQMTENLQRFLKHQAQFLQNPIKVPYRGLENEELAQAARTFCNAQREVGQIEEGLVQLRQEVVLAEKTQEMLRRIGIQLNELASPLEEAESQLLSETEQLQQLEKKKLQHQVQVESLEKYLIEASSRLQSLGMQLETPYSQQSQSHLEEEYSHFEEDQLHTQEESPKEVIPVEQIRKQMEEISRSVQITESSLKSAQQKQRSTLEQFQLQEERIREKLQGVESLRSQRLSFLQQQEETGTNLDDIGSKLYDLSENIHREESRLELGKKLVAEAQINLLHINSQIK